MLEFERLESEVRSYCRSFPTVFERADGSFLFDEKGRRYIDFFAGAGALNYGHNPEPLRRALVDYLTRKGITHSLDMASAAKRDFMTSFEDIILKPRGLRYKFQFPGPTGTNAVEAALKLARKVTGRHTVLCFTNSFHGMTLGSLAVTGNAMKRGGAGVPLGNSVAMPFDSYFSQDVDTLEYLEAYLQNAGSGMDLPAAAIVETVQAEGGVNVARMEWLRKLSELLKRYDILLVVDDIQVGCGRTGPFFSFEPAGISPDIVVLSKALSGYGIPLSLVLLRPELDCWEPGEHNGTFRGHNLAFVTATEALKQYWVGPGFSARVQSNTERLMAGLEKLARDHALAVRGRGLIAGLVTPSGEAASELSRRNFEAGLITETAGPEGEVLKFLPPLTVEPQVLDEGLEILAESLAPTRTLVGV